MLESEVEGPYGFLFYASQLGCVVFGRDPLGRHSLLVHLGVFPVPNREECEVEFILSSVGVQHGKEDSRQQKRERTTDEDEEEPEETAEEACWVELPVTGLYGLSLDDPLLQSVEAGENVLQRCGLLHCAWRGAYHLAHPLLMEEQTAPSLPIGSRGENTLSLANTAVESELPKLLLERIRQSSPVSSEGEDVWAHWAASRYLYALSNSVLRRCNVSNSGAEDGSKIEKVFQARRRPLCVLFSGGIDCTVLAALAHYLLPIETPIELINVAFGSEPEKAPDRIAAKRAMTELLQLPQPTTPEGEAQTAPPVREREWRLVFVDVPEKKNENTQHVLDIIYPCKTVMDFDIGTALWNAARGEGRMQVLRKSDLPVDATATTGVLGDFSKHIREGGSTEEKHAPAAPMGKKGKPEPPANFDKLIDVLVDEGRQSGGTAPVLLSTLGKEYAAFLKPCWQPLGYKKLGSYLNDAVKAGVIAFDPTAACKAVRLVRPEDLERAKPQPPLLWYETQQMQKDGSRTPLLYSHTYTSGAKVLLLGTGADETLEATRGTDGSTSATACQGPGRSWSETSAGCGSATWGGTIASRWTAAASHASPTSMRRSYGR
ncbi:hypothetical protein AGDE_13103 [Angomonas deanei]|uniref:Asparagine synthase, putative n=1 Tax=Angomonas deanei TaxID=59799 RepID=A0A7G2CIS8_9TRYP|nr:hypothetical protein AGDE_13103 [Angomonas deanei]CAD2218533.1 Asparagine synthase, putative [Angomonas deanei]|eukprot:EPY22723.1 hypothetical protein AGDE_13103 [Angomonas deanei]